MKKFYIFLLTLIAVNGTVAQWFPQNSGTTKTLRSVYFTDENTGYAVGDSGTILKTINGGTNWVSQNSEIVFDLYSVCFTDSNTGYAVGDGDSLNEGIILKTLDGGEDWNSQTTPVSGRWNSVFFTGSDTGYVVGSVSGRGSVLKTLNGGTVWSEIYRESELGLWSSFSSVNFPDKMTGYVVGDKMANTGGSYGIIIKTTDGGENWTFLIPGGTDYLSSVYFSNADTGYTTGRYVLNWNAYASILKTTDGGITWHSNDRLWTQINSLYFTDSENGYAAGVSYGEGAILKTTDGGNTWTSQWSGTTNGLSSVYFKDANTGYVVGFYGTISKTTNGGGFVSINEPVSAASIFTLYPNPATIKINISTNRTLPGETMVSIITISGQPLMQTRFQSQKQFEMDVSTLRKGIYLVRIQTNTIIESKKLVIQ